MSDTESTQLWNDEEDEVQGEQAFSDALASLEGHLQEYQEQDQSLSLDDELDAAFAEQFQAEPGTSLEDEAVADAALFEEGASYDPGIDEDGEPAAASLAEMNDISSLDAELDAAFEEQAAESSFDSDLDAALDEPDAGLSLDDELDNAYADETALAAEDAAHDLADDYDAAVDDSAPADAFGTHDDASGDDEGFLAEDEPAEADFAAYPSYEETEEDMDSYSTPVAEEAPADSPMSAMMGGHEGTDDFNLATLTQLVDEIRQESDRVSEMKESVARALSLIQEMSESLKS